MPHFARKPNRKELPNRCLRGFIPHPWMTKLPFPVGWDTEQASALIDPSLNDFVTLHANINYTQERGRYPSDHYPVEATLRLK